MRRVAAQCAALVALVIVAVATLMPLPGPAEVATARVQGGLAVPRTQAAEGEADPHADPAGAARLRTVRGMASTYTGTAGFVGIPSVALPGPLGGRYSGSVEGHVTICADRCARLPIVDWCDCYWGSSHQRVVDLSRAAWQLVTDRPLSAGLVPVWVILDDPVLVASVRTRGDG